MAWFSPTWFFNISFLVGFSMIVFFIYMLITTKKKKYNMKLPDLYKIREQLIYGADGRPKDDLDYEIERDEQRQKKGKKQEKRRNEPKPKKYNKSQSRCHEIFEQYFNKKFIEDHRPDWLKNEVTGRNLELDGFCPDIKTQIGQGVAYEYDGRQHSKYTPYFHREGGKQEFVYQTKKDYMKDLLCKKEGVVLIRIPHYISYYDLEKYIHTKLKLHRL